MGPRVRFAAALLAVLVPLVAVPAASPAATHEVSSVGAVLTDVAELPSEVAPTLVAGEDGRLVLVTEVPVAGRRGLFHLLLRTRHGDGAWSAPVVVTDHLRWGPPAVALARSGALAVAWPGRHSLLTVRVASADGVWDAPYVVGARLYGRPQVRINAAGDVVAAADRWSGAGRVGVRREGTWSTTHVPGYGAPSVGIDDAGVVYTASGYADRGGDGDVTVARLALTGRWSRPQTLGGISRKVQQAELQVAPHGALTLAVGYASHRWVSTVDTESYFTTGYAVLHRASWGEAFRPVWRRDGVTGLTMAASGSGRVRLSWEEWRAPDHERRPTHALVRSRQVLPRRGATLTLASQPESVTQGYFATWTALAPDGTATVLWQGRPAGSRDQTPAVLARVRGAAVLGRVALPGSQGPYAEVSEPALAATAAGTWVAWTRGFAGGRGTSIGLLPAAS